MKNTQGTNIICNSSEKICFTLREAGTIINQYSHHHENYAGHRMKFIPKRSYYCKECGYFHLTHLAFYEESADA